MREEKHGEHQLLKTLLLVLMVAFSAAAIIFSLVVLFSDLRGYGEVSPAQRRGMFTVFIYDYINDVHPQAASPGSVWEVVDVDFKTDNLAVVEAEDGKKSSLLEFVYLTEGSNVRVMKINDISEQELQDAQLALIRYLDALRKGRYEEAALLYAGPLSRLSPYGDATLKPELAFESYCRSTTPNNQCLLFSLGDPVRDPQSGAYTIPVTYALNNGEVFVTPSGKSQFSSIVERKDGQYYVITLPFD